MAPPKRIAEKMSESSNKRIKHPEPISGDLVEHVMSFLPIQSLHRNRVVSKRYTDIAIRSHNLDFSRIFSVGCSQLEAVGIIDKAFNHHKGSDIRRLALYLDPVGIEDKIISWINTCIDKNIQDFVLDFSRGNKFMHVPIDFWAIETLKVLKLQRCRFELPDDSPKGLKLLTTLSLVETYKVKEEMVDAIFRECVHLESLELIACQMFERLSINAENNKNFKSLVVSSMPGLRSIHLDAPTLEYYKYDGYVIDENISGSNAVLKEANLLYSRKPNRDDMKVPILQAYKGVNVLATTTIFLEAFTPRYVGRGRWEKRCTHKFENLREFTIFFKTPTVFTLYDIAEFLKDCPKLEKFLIDVKNFRFEPQMSFWEIDHKHQIENNKYSWELLREVEIMGYKGNHHELDIVQFFVKNAPSLEKLKLLLMPRDVKFKKARLTVYESINFIKSIFPRVEVKEV